MPAAARSVDGLTFPSSSDSDFHEHPPLHRMHGRHDDAVEPCRDDVPGGCPVRDRAAGCPRDAGDRLLDRIRVAVAGRRRGDGGADGDTRQPTLAGSDWRPRTPAGRSLSGSLAGCSPAAGRDPGAEGDDGLRRNLRRLVASRRGPVPHGAPRGEHLPFAARWHPRLRGARGLSHRPHPRPPRHPSGYGPSLPGRVGAR